MATDMDGNPKLPEPPVKIFDFKLSLEIFIAAVTVAQDGGKKAIAERNKQRRAFIRMMNKQADYVEEVAGTDVTVVVNAGFQVLGGPVPAQELNQPTIDKIVQKHMGQQQVFLASIAGARIYQVCYGIAGPGGTPPLSWIATLDLASPRPAPVISGLTPGTVYAFQVRAFGRLGWTKWSELVTKMST